MTITEKLNEIEEQTKEIAQQARELETNKRAYEGLLRCGCNAMFARTTPTTHGIPVNTPSDIPLTTLIPEEDE